MKNDPFKSCSRCSRRHRVDMGGRVLCPFQIHSRASQMQYMKKISTSVLQDSIQKCQYYCETSNISRGLVGIKIDDRSDLVGASPPVAAPTTSSFSTLHLGSMDWAKTTARGDKKRLSFGFGALYIRIWRYFEWVLDMSPTSVCT